MRAERFPDQEVRLAERFLEEKNRLPVKCNILNTFQRTIFPPLGFKLPSHILTGKIGKIQAYLLLDWGCL
jgi:hypothetical protein